jgi:hypothetical protein
VQVARVVSPLQLQVHVLGTRPGALPAGAQSAQRLAARDGLAHRDRQRREVTVDRSIPVGLVIDDHDQPAQAVTVPRHRHPSTGRGQHIDPGPSGHVDASVRVQPGVALGSTPVAEAGQGLRLAAGRGEQHVHQARKGQDQQEQRGDAAHDDVDDVRAPRGCGCPCQPHERARQRQTEERAAQRGQGREQEPRHPLGDRGRRGGREEDGDRKCEPERAPDGGALGDGARHTSPYRLASTTT